MDAANAILSSEGYLVLEEDPELWIRRNPSHRLSVRRLKLDYSDRGVKGFIGDSLGEFTELTHLSIYACGTVTHLPDTLPSLRKLKVLDLFGCYELQELPPNLGDLYALTSLSLHMCSSIKSLPGSLGKLSNLTDLFISNCDSLEELPENLGELESLTHFTLHYCRSIKFLPSSVAELPKLTTLTINICYNLEELPANFGELKSLTHFTLVHCFRIKLLPKLPNKLTNLTIESCDALEGLPENMGELKSLTHVFIEDCRSLRDCPSNMNLVDLNIRVCCSIQSLPRCLSNLKHLYLPLCINGEEERFANLKYCVSLRHLKFWDCWLHKPKEFPLNVDKLPQLSFLDIQDTRIKWLPSSISKLSKLRLLLLPYGFLLDTLPYDLDESLVISVKDTHVRKTWKKLKTEMEIFSSHAVGEMGVDPSEYLSLTGDPAPWIQNKSTSLSRVRILDLDLFGNLAGNIIDPIAELAGLTHLVISGGSLGQLPQTFTRISHISLHECVFECNMKSGFDSLGKLSTLKSLDLFFLFDTRLPANVDLPVSLRHLSLGSGYIDFTPLLDSMTKLSNLKALHLFGFEQFDLLPKNLNLEKLKLVDCYMTNIKSLPRGLRHLEILHTKGMCISKCNKLGSWFNQLVDVETLSVTCHYIKFLPLEATSLNLQELQLKDCFSIEQLPPNLDALVNLCTLNLSGTRIKALPHSISKLPKLQCLILPKCFQPESLPLEIRNQPLVSFDNTDDRYYEDMGYYDSYRETCNEADDNTTNAIELEEGSTSQQNISSHQLLDQPDATPVFKDYNFDGRDSNHINTNRHSCNQEMPENMICLNEVLKESEKRITAEQQSSRKQLLNLPDSIRDSNSIGSSDLIGKNNRRAISPSQNQEREPISLGDCDKMITDDNSSCDETDVSHSGNSLNSLEENKKCKRQRKEITWEDIRSLVDKGMTLSDAGQELVVSERTLKRRCRELGIKEWPSSRHHDTNMREVSSRLSSMSWSNFQVKAYNVENRDIVRFDLSLSSNIDQLKYEIGRKLGLEVGKFKIKYKDDDGDLLSVTCITDLKHAQSLSKGDHVKLLVIPET